jgi:hypothetical protein
MASLPRIEALDPSPYGVNSHIARDELLAELARIGVRWHRIDVDWDLIERAEGEYDWRELDRVVVAAQTLGLSLLASIAYTPGWASGTGNRASPPRDPSKYHGFVRTVAQRYRNQVQSIGIWNEPNLRQFFAGTRTQYLNDILVPGLRAVRETPEIVTAGPDLSSAGNALNDWLAPILDAAGSLFDVIAHHQYDGQDTVAGRVAEIERLHDFLVARGYGDRRLWITEIGWERVTPQQQAQHLRGVIRAMRARSWWNKTFWYDSHGPGWGLFEADTSPNPGAPKPAFEAYREVIAESAMPNFRHVVTLAYQEILQRLPDPGGLEHYNGLMNNGLTEGQLREALLRSAEFAIRFPSTLAARKAAARGKGAARRAGARKAGRGR